MRFIPSGTYFTEIWSRNLCHSKKGSRQFVRLEHISHRNKFFIT